MGKTYTDSRMPGKFWLFAIASAVLPDADVVGFGLGIHYEDMLGHRGLTHSLPFALLWGFGVVWCEFKEITRFSRRWWSLVAFFFAVTASHGVLDAFTNGGLGVAFFAPFSVTRYFFPWNPIEVSPLTVKEFFSQWGGAVVKSELLWVWLPFSMLWLGACWLRKILYRK